MGDILSQNEIDALLNQLSSGELDVEAITNVEEKPVRDYDFSRPTKFSKEHLRTLEIIFEHYGRLISTKLPVLLRKNAQVTVASSEISLTAVQKMRPICLLMERKLSS